jgi:hypothetical protein
MTNKDKTPEIIFAPGCFDNFDGTQEELDEMILEIQRMVESGELFENSQPVALDDLDNDDLEAIAEQLEILENGKDSTPRKLH